MIICVTKPRAKNSYWGDQEPPVYSASIAFYHEGSPNTADEANRYFNSERVKAHKLVYYAINKGDHFNEAAHFIQSVRSKNAVYFEVNLQTGGQVMEMMVYIKNDLE